MSNANNKDRLIKLLVRHLTSAEVEAQQATSDADSQIISNAPSDSHQSEGLTVMVGTDTDLFVALIARSPEHAQLFRPSSTTANVFCIRSLQNAMVGLKDSLLSMHAVTMCDTTSASVNKSKKKVYNILRENPELVREISVST